MWVAILVAAALLLISCTAYVYREEIKGFVMEIYKEYAKVYFSDVDIDNVPKIIEDKYNLGYVPEGFELVEEIADFDITYQKFRNEVGESIVFWQGILNEESFVIDVERGTIDVMEYGGYEILTKTTETIKTYAWNDGKYKISIATPIYISEEEIMEMIGKIER